MGLTETEETNKFTFEAFAAHPFYTEVNRTLVQQALAHLSSRSAENPITIVDMACGTGAVTRLIAEEMAHQGRQVHLIGVDPSAEALRRAQKGMEGLGVKAEFIQGDADDLPSIFHDVDMAFFFYRLWTRRAVSWLRKEHPDVHLSREAKAVAMQWLTPEEYVASLKETGFNQVETTNQDVLISLDAWRDLGQYWLFIEGALPGVPLAQGASALENAVYQAGQELGLTEVARTWLQIIATKA